MLGVRRGTRHSSSAEIICYRSDSQHAKSVPLEKIKVKEILCYADILMSSLAQVEAAHPLLLTKESPRDPTLTKKMTRLWTLPFKVQYILFTQPWSYYTHGYQKPILRTSVLIRSEPGTPKERLYC